MSLKPLEVGKINNNNNNKIRWLLEWLFMVECQHRAVPLGTKVDIQRKEAKCVLFPFSSINWYNDKKIVLRLYFMVSVSFFKGICGFWYLSKKLKWPFWYRKNFFDHFSQTKKKNYFAKNLLFFKALFISHFKIFISLSFLFCQTLAILSSHLYRTTPRVKKISHVSCWRL